MLATERLKGCCCYNPWKTSQNCPCCLKLNKRVPWHENLFIVVNGMAIKKKEFQGFQVCCVTASRNMKHLENIDFELTIE